MNSQSIFKSPQGRQAILDAYDSILARWPIPYRTHLVPTRHGETFVLTCGNENALPLVLLHGSVSNSAMWIGDVATYSPYFRICAIDFPGEPGRSQAIRFDLSGSESIEWMDDVLKGLGIERATLLGISQGGWMAIKYASQYPQRVDKLVLLCPGGVAPEKQFFFLKALPYLFLGEWGSGKIFRLLNAGQPLDRETVRFSHLINSNFHPRLHGGPLFLDQELTRLNMPVLLIAGAQDTLLDTESTRRRLQNLLPCFTEDILPSAGHILVNLADRVMLLLVKQ